MIYGHRTHAKFIGQGNHRLCAQACAHRTPPPRAVHVRRGASAPDDDGGRARNNKAVTHKLGVADKPQHPM